MDSSRTTHWLVAFSALAAGVAATTLVLRSNHSASPSLPPATPVDASDAAPSSYVRASVVIYDDGRPLVDRWVVFHDPAGAVIASMKSGADGKAANRLPAGGMISVAYGTSVHQLVTVMGVQDGDEILVGEEEDEGKAGETVATAKVKLPGAFPQAARYAATLGVGTTDLADPGATLPLPIMRRFVNDKHTFPVLALALDTRGQALAYAFAWGSRVDEKARDVEVRPGPWSTDFREHRLVFRNAPADLASATAELAIHSGEGLFESGRRETKFVDQAATAVFRVPPQLGAAATSRIELAYAHPGDRAILTRRVKVLPAEVPIDLHDDLLAHVFDATLETTQDRARPIARWKVSGDAAKALATVVQLSWPETGEHVWTLIAPVTASSRLESPALPDAMAEWRPDARPPRVSVALISASEYGSYADVRKKGVHLIAEPPEDEGTTVRVSMTGDVVF